MALVFLTLYSEEGASLPTQGTGQSQSGGRWARRLRKRVLPFLSLRETWCLFLLTGVYPVAT